MLVSSQQSWFPNCICGCPCLVLPTHGTHPHSNTQPHSHPPSLHTFPAPLIHLMRWAVHASNVLIGRSCMCGGYSRRSLPMFAQHDEKG